MEEEFTSIVSVLENKMQQQNLSAKFLMLEKDESEEKDELDNMCAICFEHLENPF